MVEILGNFVLQLIFALGILLIFALLIELISRLFHKLLGRDGYRAVVVTGFVGTPIHELGHAIMCLLFGHKIVEMCLFQPHAPGGVLGYVNHSYNKKNIYHVIGNFFIAIGPIILGAGIMIGLLFLLIPSVGADIFSNTQTMAAGVSGGAGIDFMAVMNGIGGVFVSMFALSNFGDWRWWVFMLVCLLIAMHMKLSGADIKSGWVGMVVTIVLIFIIDVIVGLISKRALGSMTEGIMVLGSYTLSILTISLILSLIQIVLATTYASIAAIVRKIRSR